LSKIERREQKLLDLLQNYQKLDISQVSNWLNVSETTARRLCSKLEQNQKVVRIHGGVQLPRQYLSDYSYQNKELKNLHEKVAMGTYCASLIESGERIFCDSGTTIHQLVLSLVNRIKAGEVRDLVILSNSLANFDPIADICKVILIGGEVRLSRLDMCGVVAEETLRRFHISRAFLGADAISSTKGFMTTDERTSRINEMVISDADHLYVVVDSTKFDTTSFMAYATPEKVDMVITDWNLNDSVKEKFEKLGYHITRVERPNSV